MGRVKNICESIATLSLFHFFRNSQMQKKEVFLLRISSGNVNASVITWRYPQIYNFSFRKGFLETMEVYLSRILTTNSRTPVVKTSATSYVFSLQYLSE